jgi:hypothetical protein
MYRRYQPRHAAPPSARSRRYRLASAGIVVALAGSAVGTQTYAAFSSTTSNGANSFASGTVYLTDNDNTGAVIGLPTAKPGDSSTGCIRVQYTGSLASTVRLYASTTGTLAPYLTLTVTRGTDSSPAFKSCSSFTADATNYIGQGAGVVFNGLLSAYPATYAAGLVDPTSGTPATWNLNDAHSYKFVITLNDDNNAQGKNADTTFTWEARNT